MAANLALFYDFTVLIIDNDSVGRLDAGQDEILRQAAATTLQRSIDERVRDDAAFRDACTQGGNLTAAPSTKRVLHAIRWHAMTAVTSSVASRTPGPADSGTQPTHLAPALQGRVNGREHSERDVQRPGSDRGAPGDLPLC